MIVTMKSLFVVVTVIGMAAQGLAQTCGKNVGVCPNNQCCSHAGFCGADDAHCLGDCQQQYGSCGSPKVPNCPGWWNTAGGGRKVGYYHHFADDRTCNQMRPKDIRLDGFSHAVFSFAKFDSKTFQITEDTDVKTELYREFTARQTPFLKTWISIGGSSFGAQPWQAMVRNGGSRGAFIRSIMWFMNTYGFSGVDLDWEFPQSQADGRAFVTLLSEMQGAFQGRYGVSVALPNDPAILCYLYPHDMQDHVDFFNLMTYDYNTPQRGNTVQSHTPMDRIEATLKYMWKNDIDPKKINLGLAYYAYGYTLADPKCTWNGCPSAGKGKELGCTNDPDAVLPLFVIDQVLDRIKQYPYIDRNQRVALITYDTDQYVSFDNHETLGLKTQRANELCLGGVMVWTISDAPVGQQPLKFIDFVNTTKTDVTTKHKRYINRPSHVHAAIRQS